MTTRQRILNVLDGKQLTFDEIHEVLQTPREATHSSLRRLVRSSQVYVVGKKGKSHIYRKVDPDVFIPDLECTYFRHHTPTPKSGIIAPKPYAVGYRYDMGRSA